MQNTFLTRAAAWVIVPLVFLGVSSTVFAEPGQYAEPDIKADIFSGTPTQDKAELQKTATALADLARNGLAYETPKDLLTAARVLGVAMHIDPDCRDAVVLNGELLDQEKPIRDEKWDEDRALNQVRKTADAARVAAGGPDKLLAAYLYTCAHLITGDRSAADRDDLYQAEMLRRAGVRVSWSWVRGAASERALSQTHLRNGAGMPPAPEVVRPVTKIHGLMVIQEPDGRLHGRAVELIAIPGERRGVEIAATNAGPEMRKSFDEALRLVKTRHARADWVFAGSELRGKIHHQRRRIGGCGVRLDYAFRVWRF